MINFCGSVPPTQAKTSGKTHCRRDELTAHRNTITIANEMMLEAANSKDYEAVSKWSEMIDFAQKKVFEIIDQEDVHAEKAYAQVKDMTGTAVEITEKAVKTGSALKLIG